MAVVRDFTFFTGTSNGSDSFCIVFLYNFLFFLILVEFLGYQMYGVCSDCYRLSCLREILLLMYCFACFDETIVSIGGISHGKVILQ